MVVEEHMVCVCVVAFNRMSCATYWFNPNILLHEKHYTYKQEDLGLIRVGLSL